MKTYARRWHLSGEIVKAEELPDGSIEVEGICSTPDRDADGEKVTPECMAKALDPGAEFWRFPALRVQHQPVPAGRVIEGSVGADGKARIRAIVVAEEPVKLVKAGVLRAFSIGGRVRRRNAQDPSIIEEITLREISLCDVPSNRAAVIEVVKRDPEPCAACASAAERLAKIEGEHGLALAKAQAAHAGALAEVRKVSAQRDHANRQAAKLAAERDRLRKMLAEAQGERDGAHRLLRERGKGATRDVRGLLAVEKADDSAGRLGARPEPEADPTDAVRALIRKSHANPQPLAADGGPLRRRGL